MPFLKDLVTPDTLDLTAQSRALLEVIAFLWIVHLINWCICRGGLNVVFGIRPREFLALPGIVTAHFLHGADPDEQDLEGMNAHLVGNTLVFAPLGLLIILNGINLFYFVTLAIVLICGLGTWLFGRESTCHVGSSGVVYGYFGFILLYSLLSGSLLRFILAIVVGIFYRRMIETIAGVDRVGWVAVPYWLFYVLFAPVYILVPVTIRSNTSWEMHLFGLLGGVFTAYFVSYAQVTA